MALHPDTLRALNAGRPDWAAAQPELGSEVWPEADRRVLRYRLAALEDDPSSAPYLLHAIVDDEGRILGRIGCHAGPDAVGEVEIGYFVRADARGHGVAGWAVDEFLGWLASVGVTSVLASVRPDNEPSLVILRRRDFVEVDSHVDEEDGLELVYRRSP